ncbi:MAG: hypothetical protein Kilf2KO_38830 [Rhodospirillales bacterium]
MSILNRLRAAHMAVFGVLDRATEGWLLGSLARLLFLLVLFVFFWKSAMTKLGDGFFGFLSLSNGAYFQIVPKAVEAASYNPANVGFGADLIVFFGTWAEIVLPILIVVGLFSRLASLGMIGFIAIMTYVDLTAHGLKPEVVGSLLDANAGAIWDERTLWVFLLLVIVLKGPGPLSLDRLCGWLLRRRRPSEPAAVTMES